MLEVALRHRFPGAAGFRLDAAFATDTPGVTALFGPSGCGKSTILAAIAGLLRPAAGRVALDGQVLFDAEQRRCIPPERRRCGVVFQDARLFPHLSVESNLRYGLRRAPPGRDAPPAGAAASGASGAAESGFEASGAGASGAGASGAGQSGRGESRSGASGFEAPGFEEVVALLGLVPLLRRRPAGLSGGERQRVALGRALLSRPRLLLMDEPLAALDTARKAEVLPFLARLRERLRIPVLYVTHALDEVDALADGLVLVEAGRVLASGTVEALSARTDLPLLAGRRDAGAVLACIVLAHDPGRGLTRLGFAGGELVVPLHAAPPGSRRRLRLRARDIAVATEAPRGLSVQNVLPAVLERIEPGRPNEAMLRLRLGGSVLLARVTRDAVARLGLTPGMPVWALVKSVAFADPGGGDAGAGDGEVAG